MKRLRWSFAAVIVTLTFLFNVERLDLDDTNTINLSSFVYVLGFLVVATAVVVRVRPAKGSWAGAVAAAWVGLYLVGKLVLFPDRPFWGGIHSYLTLTELTIVVSLSLLANTLVARLREFEDAVATLTLTDVSRKVRALDEAHDEIQDRLLLSRRHQRPLSVVVFGLDSGATRVVLPRVVEEVQRGMANRYVVNSLAAVMVRNLRRTDLPLERGRDGRFIVLCPETDASGAALAARHVQKAVRSALGVDMDFGIAAFPADALTFAELLGRAEGQLRAAAPVEPLAVSEGRT
jgi:GGDEF domain-containing protein